MLPRYLVSKQTLEKSHKNPIHLFSQLGDLRKHVKMHRREKLCNFRVRVEDDMMFSIGQNEQLGIEIQDMIDLHFV